jgi:hypothetical protein
MPRRSLRLQSCTYGRRAAIAHQVVAESALGWCVTISATVGVYTWGSGGQMREILTSPYEADFQYKCFE